MEVLAANQYHHHHHHHAEHAKPATSYEKLFTSESMISSRVSNANVDTHRFDDSSNISMQQSQQQMQQSSQSGGGDESQQQIGKKKRSSQSLLAEHKNLLLQSTGDKSDKILFEPSGKAKLNIKIKESLTTNTNSKSNKTEGKSKKETKKSEMGAAAPILQASSIQPTSPLIIQQKISTTIDKKQVTKKTKKKKTKKSNSGTSSNGGNTNADDQGAGDSMGEETGEKDSATMGQQAAASKIDSSETDLRNNESVRWENEVSDENDELKRLEVYKQNRRKRYMEEQNKSKQTKVKETVIVEDLESLAQPSKTNNQTLSASVSFRKTSARLLNRNLIDINYELDELKLSAAQSNNNNNNNTTPITTQETHVIESISNLRRPSLSSSNNKKLTDSAVSSMSSNSNKF